MRALTIAAIGLILTGLPHGAAAQDVGRDVRRAIEAARTEIQRHIEEAIREVRQNADPNIRARARGPNSDFRSEQTQRETKKLAIGANGALDLETVSGNITVTASAGQEATVDIVRVSRGRTDADAKLGLDRVTVEVEQRGERASVRANYPDDRGRPAYQVSVSYTVSAPPGTRLSMHSVGGDVKVTGIRGQMTAETTGGNVTIADAGQLLSAKTIGGNVSVSGAQTDGTLEASSIGGNVTVQQTKAKRISISTVGGDVAARDVTCDTADLGTMSGNVEFSGPVSKGGRYELHAQSGTIHFTPANDAGYELQARTFSGQIRTDVPMRVQGTVSGRGPQREVRGTVGDGSAVVIARTFSGNVIVGKR